MRTDSIIGLCGKGSVAACLSLLLLLSCSKPADRMSADERIPISFSANAEKTRTLVSTTALPASYTVYASSYFTSYTTPETDGDYFKAVPFTHAGSVWVTDPVIYWPAGGKLDFIAVACEDEEYNAAKGIEWYEGNCSKGVQISLRDGECLGSEVMFASTYDRSAEGGTVPLHFKHAQCWLQFVIGCESDVLRIDSIVIEDVYTGGLFRVSNNVYLDAEWTYRGHRKADVTVPGSEGVTPAAGTPTVCNILVPEQDACDILIRYSVRSSPDSPWETARQSAYRYRAGANPWYYGEKNVFFIDFVFAEITLTASVSEWEGFVQDIKFDEN